DYNYRTNPPPADGTKVVVSDTDHLWGIGGDPAWVWKSFCRGLNPIFMDPYDHRVLTRQPDAPWEAVRQALGHTRQLAERLDLTTMMPQDRLASTGYCLARPGGEYVVYLPEGGRATVDLSAASGDLRAEWLQAATGKWTSAEAVRGGAEREVAAPFSGHAVLYLRTAQAGEN
ncbi:MAG: putative collagen-binding domain-containing protein, partial [Haloechinothrix sp.]